MFHDIIIAVYETAPGPGVDPAVAVAQSAKETGYGRFGGVLTAEWRNTCFPPGTLVETPDGLRSIEAIHVGDVVFGHDGKPHEVMAAMKRYIDEPLVTVRTLGAPPHRMTSDHTILVTRLSRLVGRPNRKETRADPDWFTCWGTEAKQWRRDSVVREWVPAATVQVGDLVWGPVIESTRSRSVGQSLLSLLGWYLAEGSVAATGRIAFSLHAKETSAASKIDGLLRACFSKDHITHPLDEQQNKRDVIAYSRSIGRELARLGGKGAAGKRILPDWFYHADDLLPLLVAYLRGDGTFGRKQVCATTVSVELAHQIKTVLLRLGIVPSWTYRVPQDHVLSGGRLIRSRLPTQRLIASGSSATQLASLLGYEIPASNYEQARPGVLMDGMVAYPIREVAVDDQPYIGPVHNLSVETAESYVLAGHVAVHNCGLKTRAGGANDDPEAHQRFPSWDEGALAHCAHLALYAGHITPERAGELGDPRNFSSIHGVAPTVEQLGGRWAPAADYGRSIVAGYLTPLRNT